MKRKFVFILSTIFVMILLFQIFQNISLAAQPITASIQNNNTSGTFTSFNISSSGTASVYVRYNGYPNITTGAEISITIKKNTFLWFYSTVVDETYSVEATSYFNTYTYDITESGSGKYKCNVTYTISGSGGADDVIPFEDTASY